MCWSQQASKRRPLRPIYVLNQKLTPWFQLGNGSFWRKAVVFVRRGLGGHFGGHESFLPIN